MYQNDQACLRTPPCFTLREGRFLIPLLCGIAHPENLYTWFTIWHKHLTCDACVLKFALSNTVKYNWAACPQRLCPLVFGGWTIKSEKSLLVPHSTKALPVKFLYFLSLGTEFVEMRKRLRRSSPIVGVHPATLIPLLKTGVIFPWGTMIRVNGPQCRRVAHQLAHK